MVKKIYDQSKFLKVCSYYLENQTNYLYIVDKEFISVAKAFQLKREVEKYFIESNIMDS